MFPRSWSGGRAPWIALAAAAVGLLAVALWVDLAPRVESDFFFAEDDPQLQATREIDERFPAGQQALVRAQDLSRDRQAYRTRIRALTADLEAVEGIETVYSITTDDPTRSALFRRILLTPDSAATNVVLAVAEGSDPELLLPRLEAVLERHESEELHLVASGVPVIVELIRRSLLRDLVLFSAVAVAAFGLLLALVYRDAAVVAGTLVTSLISVSATLVLTKAMGVAIGLLTANLITIVFVLTLSHLVFLTGSWRITSAAATDRAAAAAAAVGLTREASFWSMATTLLGFLSLLFASARPLRELGIAGAVGTVTALLAAYAVYPAFLARWAHPGTVGGGAGAGARAAQERSHVPVIAVFVAVAALGVGLVRLDTDPGLLTYFAEGSRIREGLEQVDADGGSSTLNVVVRDTAGRRIDHPAVYDRLGVYQAALEADSAVGVVLSPRVLLEHARLQPLAGFMSLEVLLDLMASPELGGIARGFVSEDRQEARFSLRMREGVEEPSRQVVIDRVGARAAEAGLAVVTAGGLYDLQAQLGRLIGSSLRLGIGGLLMLFLLIAYTVARSTPTACKMWLCLAGIPLVVLGTFGTFGVAVDIITSPAANIALAMGVDSMIHLVVRVRRLDRAGSTAAWAEAVRQLRAPILAATATIAAGFGIFVLSSFPPTRRFGGAVILGTVTAAVMALVVLPRMAAGRPGEQGVAEATLPT